MNLDQMWIRLEAHQPYADERGYGPAWSRMCEKRTEEAARAAAEAAKASWVAAARAAMEAAWAVGDMSAERAVMYIEKAEKSE